MLQNIRIFLQFLLVFIKLFFFEKSKILDSRVPSSLDFRVRVFKKGPSLRVFESESRLGSAPKTDSDSFYYSNDSKKGSDFTL